MKNYCIKVDGIHYKVFIEQITFDRCACGCGQDISGRQTYKNSTCRKRAERSRKNDLVKKIINNKG